MMSSCPDYGRYAQEVLAKQMDPVVLDSIRQIEARGDYANPRYMELLMLNFFTKHVCRLPLNEWMASQVQSGTYLHCPNGSHMNFYDDQATYFNGLIQYLKKVENKHRIISSGSL